MSISGFVFFARIPAIIRLRTSAGTISAMSQNTLPIRTSYDGRDTEDLASTLAERSVDMKSHRVGEKFDYGHDYSITELPVRLRV